MDTEPPPGNDLTVFLWLMAILIATMELAWVFFSHALSP
jgi:hypothetical protein